MLLMPRRGLPSAPSGESGRGGDPRLRPVWRLLSRPSRRMPAPKRAVPAQYDHYPRRARLAWRYWSFAEIADLTLILVRAGCLRDFAAMVLVEHGGAPAGIGRHFPARLHQVSLVFDHGSQVALRSAP